MTERRSVSEDHRRAEHYHEVEWQLSQRLSEAAINNANLALKMMLLLNGGAAVAVMAFVGGLAAADVQRFGPALPNLTAPLIWFAGGAAIAAVAMVLSYCTNGCFAEASRRRKRTYEHPYLLATDSSAKWVRWGLRFLIAAVLVALGSLGLFCYAVFAMRSAVVSLGL